MMHTLPFRLSKKQHIVIRLLAVFAVLAVLTASGLAVIPGPTPAQAQTQNIPVSPTKRDFTNTSTKNTYTFTVDADATMNSLDFNVTGSLYLVEYDLLVNGKSLKKERFDSPSQKLPYSKTVSGLNSTLKKGDKINLYLEFNFPREKGSVSVTPKGTLGGSTPTPTPTPTSTPDPSIKTVTPAAPTAVDPATGHGFTLNGDPVNPDTPNAFTAKVGEDAQLNYITVRIKTEATFLDPQYYHLTVDKIEDGVTLQKRNVKIGNGYITMDVVPVKDGQKVDSAFLPKGAVFTFTNNLAQNKSLAVELDAYGTKSADPTEPPEIKRLPYGAEWVNGRVPNPPMPQRCGLRIAVVADLSTSLNYADSNGFTESKNAANALIDSLAGTPAELGIYNFAGGAPRAADGSTYRQNPPYISLQSEQGVNRAKNIVANWRGDGATNWEAGLKQVAAGNYDVVYFITDGMPTLSSSFDRPKNAGGFVQASALNDAIKAANDLKASGTRVVPIMVDLTLGGKGKSRYTVTEDYVLKDVREWTDQTRDPQESGLYYQIYSSPDKAKYIDSTDVTANFKWALEGGGVKIMEKRPDKYSVDYVEKLPAKWTYGKRGVQTMGEDISGTGDTIRVEQYSKLAEQLKQIGEQLASRCNGVVKVKKRIVDENGEVRVDGAPGWEFTLSAGQDIIDSGNGELVRRRLKVTSSAEKDRGTAKWNIKSETSQDLTLTETQKQGYSLYQRNGKNAVCQETRDGKTKPIDVKNEGEFGFTVNMSGKDKKLSHISCEVDNYKTPEATGKLTFKKAQYDDGKITEMPGLGGATFEIYPAKDGMPDYSAGKPLYTIKPDQESIEVKTGTFFLVETKAPNGLNLLPKPVPFEISFDKDAKTYKISTVGDNPQIKSSGSGDAMLLVVADTASGKLPKTGGNGVLVWALAGLMMAGGGALWMRRRQS